MFSRLLPVLALLFLSGPTLAATESLFFTPDQLARINQEVLKNPPVKSAHSKHVLHLGSVLYFGKEKWVIWLQGRKWTPETQEQQVRVLDVSPKAVRLTVTLRNGSLLENVVLRPHQSLDLLTGAVLEGL